MCWFSSSTSKRGKLTRVERFLQERQVGPRSRVQSLKSKVRRPKSKVQSPVQGRKSKGPKAQVPEAIKVKVQSRRVVCVVRRLSASICARSPRKSAANYSCQCANGGKINRRFTRTS